MIKKIGVFFALVALVFTVSCSNNLDDAKPATGTLVIGGDGSRAIEVNTITAADISVYSDDMTAIKKTEVAVSNGAGSVKIEDIPVGNNRIISVSAKDASGRLISGGVMYAVTDIKAGVNTIGTITWKTSRKGIVYDALLNGGVKISSLGSAESAKINAAIPDVAPENILVDEFVTDYNNGNGTLKDKSAYIKNSSGKTLSYIELEKASDLAFTVTAHYTDSTNDDVTSSATWDSTNKAAATVSKGAITLVGAGETEITATLQGKISNAATVKVSAKGGNIDKLYFVPNGWDAANAWFAAYFFKDGGEGKWVKMEKSGDKYVCTKPDGYSTVIFCRMNPAKTTLDWNSKWTQTGDLAIPTDKDTFKPSALTENVKDAWVAELSGTYGGGSLSATVTLGEVVVPAKPVVTIDSLDVKLNGKITITVKSASTLTASSVKIGGVTKNLVVGTNTFAVSDFTSVATTLSVSGTVSNELGSTSVSGSIKVSEGPVAGDMPTEWDELRIYQVMVSSFQDGDPSIGYSDAHGPSNALKGGDLRGIINSLDYIKGLGMNALWMTPIFDSSRSGADTKLNSTGYFAYNYFDIDPNFGTKQVFAELVEKAHERGIAIILDGVFGHWGANGVAESPKGKKPMRSNGQYKACDYPASLDFFNEVASYWITDYKIDGWRFDQCYQVGLGENGNGNGDNCYTGGHNYWYDIRMTIKNAAKQNGDFGTAWGTLGYTVGEHWKGDASLIQKGSVAGGSAAGDGLQSCFDFPARYQLIQSLAREEENPNATAVFANAIDYTMKTGSEKGYRHSEGYHPNVFLTNHDLVRFGNLLNWKFSCSPSSNTNLYFGKHKLAIAIVGAYSGPITVYYGDEWGAYVDGYNNKGDLGAYNDNAARSTGKISGFNSNEQSVIDFTTGVMKARAEHPALWKGANTKVQANGDVYVGKKTYKGETITYILNNSGSAYSYQASGTDLITGNAYTGSCPAYSAVYILNK